MSITQTQLKGTVVLNSDAGANLTVGNSTATNAITGTTNINTSGTANTSIGVNGSTTAILGTTNINASGGSLTTIGNISAGGIINLSSPDIRLGGTTTIVDIGALTGTGINRLNKSLTPAYSYPVSTGQVGQIITGTITTPLPLSYPNINTGKEMASMSLTKGVWSITSYIKSNPFGAFGSAGGYAINAVNTTSGLIDSIYGKTQFTVFGGYTWEAVVPLTLSINATTTIFTNYQSNNAGPVLDVILNAVRIA